MTSSEIEWPVKTREFHDHHTDSTIWNDFKFRDDDIIISTYAKSGTTWTQQIVSQLLFDGAAGVPAAEMSPWVDMRIPPKEVKLPELEKQTHRRFLKTHLPVDAIVFSPKAKYIYIARDGRDVAWSFYNHHANANEAYYDAVNNSPGRVGPPFERPADNAVDYFRGWLENDGHPYWPFWVNIRTWWEIRDLPNVLLLHFADMKADMPGAIRKIAEFLEIPIKEDKWPAILEHCSFEYMKANAEPTVPLNGALWDGGAQTFIHKGTNGRWKDMLTEEDNRRYEAKAIEELGPECAEWLAYGNQGRKP
ncbi:MAG: sulfotransferase domain-containing protein [Alphaproteobacteria bacterium]|nr:sulfotransferase domain-containing protein [Alphaproteobacteria bacterium]